MKANSETDLRRDTLALASELVTLQRKAADAGLYETMHAINDASKKLGWEAARLIERWKSLRK